MENMLLAPNGKPSNLNAEQYKLVRTPAFKKWFGDWEKLETAKVKDAAMDEVTLQNLSKDVSKVVDENGEPKVMWHFAKRLQYPEERFNVFRVDRQLGSHFGTINQVKNLRYYNIGRNLRKPNIEKKDSDYRFFQVFLNIINPLRMKDEGIFEPETLANALDSIEKLKLYDWEHINNYTHKSKDSILDRIKYIATTNRGYDGVIYLNRYEATDNTNLVNKLDDASDSVFKNNFPNAEDSWIAFYPEQIKLADGSNTTFDTKNPDIRYASGGEVYYTRTYQNGSIEKYTKEDYENNILPFLPIQEFDKGGKIKTALKEVESAKSVKYWMQPEFPAESYDYPQKGKPNSFVKMYEEKYNADTILAYDKKGDIVGLFTISKGGDEKGAFKIVVREDSENMGWGKKLLDEAEKQGIDVIGNIKYNSFSHSGRNLLRNWLNKKMEQGGELGKGIYFENGGLVLYHGSPYEFKKFKLEKIGSGEGAQAFGWGLYFTEVKDIAKSYAKPSIDNEFVVNGVNLKGLIPYNLLIDINTMIQFKDKPQYFYGDEEKFYKRTIDALRNYALNSDNEQLFLNFKDIQSFNDLKFSRNLYTITLDDSDKTHQYTWLEWDKPITQNILSKVITALKKEGRATNSEIERIKINSNANGEDLYNTCVNVYGSTKEASLFLLRAGIDGIKYPTDTLSNSNDSKNNTSYNYVIFDENDIIMESIEKFRKGGELAKGIRAEMEHKGTIDKFKRAGVSDKDVATSIAKDHLKEDPKYYTKLMNMENKMKEGGALLEGKIRGKVVHKENGIEYYDDGTLIEPTSEEKLNWEIYGFPNNIEKTEQSFETIIDEISGNTKKEISNKLDDNMMNGKYAYLGDSPNLTLVFNERKMANGGNLENINVESILDAIKDKIPANWVGNDVAEVSVGNYIWEQINTPKSKNYISESEGKQQIMRDIFSMFFNREREKDSQYSLETGEAYAKIINLDIELFKKKFSIDKISINDYLRAGIEFKNEDSIILDLTLNLKSLDQFAVRNTGDTFTRTQDIQYWLRNAIQYIDNKQDIILANLKTTNKEWTSKPRGYVKTENSEPTNKHLAQSIYTSFNDVTIEQIIDNVEDKLFHDWRGNEIKERSAKNSIWQEINKMNLREENKENLLEAVYKKLYDMKEQPNNIEEIETKQFVSELGTGAKVYFETPEYRVNDSTYNKGEYILNVGSENSEGVYNYYFDNVEMPVFIAKEIARIYPNGVPDALLVDKFVDNLKNKFNGNEFIVSINVKDYKNPYEVNRAIEKLLDAKGSEQESYTPDEINFISYYSGYGGLEKKGKFSDEELKGLLYEYYTPDEIVQKMWGLAYKYGYGSIGDNSVFEPSVGIGAFLKYAPENVFVAANEINRYSAMICHILYPNVETTLMSFEKNFISRNMSIKKNIEGLKKYSLVIGNPPYGKLGGIYMTMGEDKYVGAANWVEYFIFRGLDLLQKGGLLLYIVGAEQYAGGTLFLDSELTKTKKAIFEKADLIDAYRLPNKLFERTGVSTEIVIFRKR